jgi:hypothetical protein
MRELRSGLFFLGLSLFALWESLRLGLGTPTVPGAGFLSFCVGLVLSILSIVLIIRGWGIRDSLESHSYRVILALVSLFIYSLVMEPVGFIVATFFLVGILFRLGEPRRWWALLGMSALVTFLAYLVFGVLLHVYFPRSFLGI